MMVKIRLIDDVMGGVPQVQRKSKTQEGQTWGGALFHRTSSEPEPN